MICILSCHLCPIRLIAWEPRILSSPVFGEMKRTCVRFGYFSHLPLPGHTCWDGIPTINTSHHWTTSCLGIKPVAKKKACLPQLVSPEPLSCSAIVNANSDMCVPLPSVSGTISFSSCESNAYRESHSIFCNYPYTSLQNPFSSFSSIPWFIIITNIILKFSNL